jgi:hypothetical protein
MLDNASSEATSAFVSGDMNACHLGDAFREESDATASNRYSFGHSDREDPIGTDQVIARILAHRRLDVDVRGRPTPIAAHDVRPVRAQRSLSEV